jgi:hypothetical protein
MNNKILDEEKRIIDEEQGRAGSNLTIRASSIV